MQPIYYFNLKCPGSSVLARRASRRPTVYGRPLLGKIHSKFTQSFKKITRNLLLGRPTFTFWLKACLGGDLDIHYKPLSFFKISSLLLKLKFTPQMPHQIEYAFLCNYVISIISRSCMSTQSSF